MKTELKVLKKLSAIVLCIALTVIAVGNCFSIGAQEAEASQYGTETEGIYSTDYTTSVFNRDPVDFLANGDFSEGLKYWAPSYTVENQNTAYYARVADGALKMSPVGDGGNKVVTSAAVTIPESLKGKEMAVLMWYKADAEGKYQFGVYTDNYTNIFNNGYGNIYTCSASEDWKLAAFNFTAPQDGVISIYLKADGSCNFNLYVDKFALATKNTDGTYNMFVDSFESSTERLNSSGIYYYGTAEEGIYTTNYSTSVFSRDAVSFLANGDFSEGLKYWAPSYTVEDQNTAYYASVTDGVLKMSPTGSSGNKVITSTAITVPDSLKGKSMTVLMWYKADAAGRFQFGVYTDNYTNIYNDGYGNVYDCSATDTWKFAAFNFTAPQSGSISIFLKADGAYNFNFYIDKFALATKNTDGTYNMFVDSFESSTERLNSSGIYYYGTAEEGIYTTNYSTSVFSRDAVSFLANGDFSEGLKYWAPSYTVENQNTAYYASVTDGVLKMSPTGSSGNKVITSTAITVPDSLKGKEMAVFMKYKTDANANIKFGVYTDNYTNIFNNGSGNVYDLAANSEWTKIPFNFTAPTSGSISIFLWANGTNTFNLYIDEFALASKNDNGTYNLFVDSFDSETVLVNSNGYEYYGTEENGIYVSGTDTKVSTLAATDVFNGDFSEGLKYWGVESGTGYATSKGALENGMFKVIGGGADTYYGLRSVYYNIPQIAYGKKIVAKYDVQTDVALAVTLYATNGTDEITLRSDNFSSGQTEVTTTQTASMQLSEGYNAVAVSFRQYGVNVGDVTKIGNFRLYYVDEGGMELLNNIDGSPAEYSYGDANADGKVDLVDLVRIKRHMADSSVPIYTSAANVNKDAGIAVNADDLTVMMDYIVGKVNEF